MLIRIARTGAIACSLAVAIAVLLLAEEARAVPSFAAQTGQPCAACHIGAFGPQLTPLGRAFKIGGYTQTGGEGLASEVPLSGMVLSSFTNTNASQPEPPASGFARNNNLALDQVSLFLAGRPTDNLGAFLQGTYSGTDRGFRLDNTDIHLTAPFDLKDTELRLGATLNNGPTVQDPYNSTYALITPFASSALAPVPTAQPLIAGGLLGNSIGSTVYAWYDRRLYLEAGISILMARPFYRQRALPMAPARRRIQLPTRAPLMNGTGTGSRLIWVPCSCIPTSIR